MTVKLAMYKVEVEVLMGKMWWRPNFKKISDKFQIRDPQKDLDSTPQMNLHGVFSGMLNKKSES